MQNKDSEDGTLANQRGYLRGLLASGARPFVYRSAVHRLLGATQPDALPLRGAPVVPPAGFKYAGQMRVSGLTADPGGWRMDAADDTSTYPLPQLAEVSTGPSFQPAEAQVKILNPHKPVASEQPRVFFQTGEGTPPDTSAIILTSETHADLQHPVYPKNEWIPDATKDDIRRNTPAFKVDIDPQLFSDLNPSHIETGPIIQTPGFVEKPGKAGVVGGEEIFLAAPSIPPVVQQRRTAVSDREILHEALSFNKNPAAPSALEVKQGGADVSKKLNAESGYLVAGSAKEDRLKSDKIIYNKNTTTGFKATPSQNSRALPVIRKEKTQQPKHTAREKNTSSNQNLLKSSGSNNSETQKPHQENVVREVVYVYQPAVQSGGGHITRAARASSKLRCRHFSARR